VALPRTCERILRKVPLPAVKAADDARVAFLKDDAALLEANARIGAGHDCIRDEHDRYAGVKSGGK
jgi:hypothetical protein